MPLKKVGAKGSLADRTYMALKEAIISKALEPNEVLNEERLAEELGVSRTPLRTALQRLAFEHLIRRQPGKGYVVASLSRADMEQVFFMRNLLEPVGAEQAAGHREEADLRRLREAVARQRSSVAEGDYLGFLQFDHDFHVCLGKASGNPYLATAVEAIQAHVYRFLLLDAGMNRRTAASIEEHQELIHALEEGDAPKACRIMEAQIAKTYEVLAEVLGESHFL